MRVANCTTAAQFFHLLRRQPTLLQKDPLPLVVLTPKSLLRHPLVASSPRHLAEGRWEPAIDDERFGQDAEGRRDVRRLVLCSGKIAVDLMTSERREAARSVAIARVEQLYPFPIAEIEEIVGRYQGVREVMWVQEEPENMGAWDFVRPHLQELLRDRMPLKAIARPRASSPAEGSAARHARTQQILIERALDAAAAAESSRRVAVGSRE
jgi:2-oxoglutarate dehydrogenase E1 component